MQTKHLIYAAAIALIAVIGTAIVSGAILGTITNINSGIGNKPQIISKLNIYYDSVNVTNGQTVDWENWNVGAVNTKNLTVTNKHTSLVQVFLQVTNLPTNWQVSWPQNGTYLNSGASTQATITVSVPDTIVNGQAYSFNSTVTVNA